MNRFFMQAGTSCPRSEGQKWSTLGQEIKDHGLYLCNAKFGNLGASCGRSNFFVESPIFGTSNSYFPILFKILKGFNEE